MRETPRQGEPNRDPISGAPGAHPVGTGLGAAGGATAGMAAGAAVGGPAGAVVGAAIGAVAGGLAGKGIAEMVDPTVEDAYWRDTYRNEPYYTGGREYDFYAPAYRTGYEGRVKYHGRAWDDVEDDLRKDYVNNNGRIDSWNEVKDATRAAWNRVDNRVRDAAR